MSHGNQALVQKGERIAIVSGLRTPFVRQLTHFSHLPAIELGAMVVNGLLQKAEIDSKLIEQLVFGQVIQMPDAPNIAREIVLSTGMNIYTDAFSVNRACATSFQSVVNLAESIKAGAIQIGIAGGADSASTLPIGVTKKMARVLLKINKEKSVLGKLRCLRQLSPKDLLPKAPAIAEYSTGLTMGQTAEQMAQTYGISRSDQDAFSQRSHHLAEQAWKNTWLDECVMPAYPAPYKSWVHQDNTVRFNSSLEDYTRLRPIFEKRHGTVTAGNSSPLSDGASALLLMKESRAKVMGYSPLGFLKSYAFSSMPVAEDMLLGPAFASPLALDRAGVGLSDLTLIDMHEAFAAQVLANLTVFASPSFAKQHLGRSKPLGEIPMEKCNVLGGSIAYGHPFAATGARIILQTLHELKRRGGGLALATSCAAGGLGAAMVLEAE